MDYNKRTAKPYNGNPLYSEVYDRYFTDLGHVEEWISDYISDNCSTDNEENLSTINEWATAIKTPAGVCEFAELHLCEPEYLQPPDFHEIDLPDCVDQLDVPEDIAQKLQDLQRLVEQRKHILWYEPTQYRPDPETL